MTSVNLKTFKKWWFHEDFAVDLDNDNNIVCLRCKICSQHLAEIRREARLRGLKGAVLTSIQNYVDGVSYVHKTNVERHVKSGGLHEWAKTQLRSQGESTSASDTPSTSGAPEASKFRSQPRVDTAIIKGARAAYVIHFKTALHVAKAEKSYSEFPSLIDLQRNVGVQCLSGKDSEMTCREMISFLAEAMRCDIQKILSCANFFCGEQDGSQPRKTGSTKELVYTKVVINGSAVELLLKCQHMNDYGEDAKSVKQAFDDTFLKAFSLNPERFQNCMIGVCADGASVNMGNIRGACTEMAHDRPWLMVIHCSNHRLELAIADAFKADKVFTRVDEMLVNVYYMFKNSGKAKRLIMQIALNLGVTFVNFVKAHGTRFQNHKYRGVKVLIINFMALCMYAENVISGGTKAGGTRETIAKLRGYLNEWKSFQYLAALHLYRQVLQQTANLSCLLQSPTVLFTDIVSAVDDCKSKLETLSEETTLNDFPFETEESSPDTVRVTAKSTNLPASTQFREKNQLSAKQKRKADKCITVHTDSVELKRVRQGQQAVNTVKQQLIPKIRECIEARFPEVVGDNALFKAFMLADTTAWDFEDNRSGLEYISTLSEVFATPLAYHHFSEERAVCEFKELKRLVGKKYRHFKSKKCVWEQIFGNFHSQYPNILLLIELCLVIPWSSASVERGFSAIGRLLTHSRLSLTKGSLDNLLLLRVNLSTLTRLDQQYEEKLVARAVDLYMQKPRYSETKNKSKKMRMDTGASGFSEDTFLPRPFVATVPPLLIDDGLALSDSERSDSDVCEASEQESDSLDETSESSDSEDSQ